LYNLVKKNNFKSDAVRIPVPIADVGTGIGFLAVFMWISSTCRRISSAVEFDFDAKAQRFGPARAQDE